MPSKILKQLWTHFMHCFSPGFRVWLIVAVVFYGAAFVFDAAIVAAATTFWGSASSLTLLIVAVIHVVLIYSFGAVTQYTQFVPWLKNRLSTHPVLLNLAGILPDPVKDAEDDFVNLEVLYYKSETERIRGYVGNKPILARDGFVWVPVHFSSPPTVKTGGWLWEYRADDPNLKFTGRKFSDHLMYMVMWGGGIESENSNEIEIFTRKIKAKLLALAKQKNLNAPAPDKRI